MLSRRRFVLGAVVLAAGGAAGVLELNENGHHAVKKLFRPASLKPAHVVDLSVWKIGLPTSTEIKNPTLEDYSDSSFKAVQAVQFTVHCGDKAQPGSKYARAELREMNADGSNASWSSTHGTHTMTLTQRVTHLPVVKPTLVCGQVHSTNDYLILVVLSGKELTVRYVNDVVGVLDTNYQLGALFELKIVASGGFVDVFYNGVRKVHHGMDQTGCYFKAGCYLQSSTATGDAPTAYGQVEISSLVIAHTR
jgi:poly(beta-D-mannuronate) lyase